MSFFKRVCWTLELSYCWVSSFIERSTSSSNREEFIHSAHSKLYLASLFKLNFSSVSSPNRSPLFVEEFKWEDLKVLQILPFCTAAAASKYSMTSIVLLNYKVLNTPPPERKKTKPRLKYGSHGKNYLFYECSPFLGFIMSKKQERLRSELLSEDKITNLLVFLT